MAEQPTGGNWYRGIDKMAETVEHCWGCEPMKPVPTFTDLVDKGTQGRRNATSLIVVVSYKHLRPGGTKNNIDDHTIDTCPAFLTHFSKPVELAGVYGSGLRQACSAEITRRSSFSRLPPPHPFLPQVVL